MRAQSGEHSLSPSRLPANALPQSTAGSSTKPSRFSQPPFPPISSRPDFSTLYNQTGSPTATQNPNNASPPGSATVHQSLGSQTVSSQRSVASPGKPSPPGHATGHQNPGSQTASPQRSVAFPAKHVAPGNATGLQSPGSQTVSPQRSVAFPAKHVAPGNATGAQSPGSHRVSPQRSVTSPGNVSVTGKALEFKKASLGSTSEQAPTERADPPRLADQPQNSNVGLSRTYASIAAPATVPPQTAVNNYVPSDQNQPTSDFFF